MSGSGKIDADDLGRDGRSEIAKNLREGVTPEAAIEDWGDYPEDYTETELAQADGQASVVGEDGVRRATAEEVLTYYDSLQPTDIRILKPDGTEDSEESAD